MVNKEYADKSKKLNEAASNVQKFHKKQQNFIDKEWIGLTPLHLAIKNKNVEAVNLLLNHPAIAVNQLSNWKSSPLDYALKIGDKDIIDALMKKKAKFTEQGKQLAKVQDDEKVNEYLKNPDNCLNGHKLNSDKPLIQDRKQATTNSLVVRFGKNFSRFFPVKNNPSFSDRSGQNPEPQDQRKPKRELSVSAY